MAIAEKKLLLAFPRGFCAGVTRAVQIVEKALNKFGAPIYVRHEIVHNAYVNNELRNKGVVFIENVIDLPLEATVIISAHGAAPEVHQACQAKSTHFIDATCPLVSKVHKLAKHYADQNYTIILIGHANHVEVIGTRGVAQEKTIVVENIRQAEELQLAADGLYVLLSQTTLSTDEVQEISVILKRKIPQLIDYHSSVCYATTNRQKALNALCRQADFIYVVGGQNSSNSNRLVELALKNGVKARLIEGENSIDTADLHYCQTVGLSAGASTPEQLVSNCVEKLNALGYNSFTELRECAENLSFALPDF